MMKLKQQVRFIYIDYNTINIDPWLCIWILDIPIVKLEDKILAKEVGVFSLPAVVFFRVNADPTIYAGQMYLCLYLWNFFCN